MNGLKRLTEFLAFLKSRGVPYSLHHFRDEAITVCFALVGERHEVYFFDDHEEYSSFLGSEDVSRDIEPLLIRIEDQTK